MPIDNFTLVKSIICIGGFLIIICLPGFFLSRLLKLEHDIFYEQWINDGKQVFLPYWFPLDECNSRSIGRFPWTLGYRWLFTTPEWTKGHPIAGRQLWIYRFVSYFIYGVMFAILFVLVLIALLR